MRRTLGTAALLVMLLSVTASAADNPFIGTWKINVEKSKYNPGPPPKSSISTMEPYGDNGIKVSIENVTAKGEKATINYSASFDGKEYPFVQTGPGAVSGQTLSLKRIDSNTVERTTYLNGKKLVTERWVVSKDGKTRTNHQSGTNEHGVVVNNVLVTEKQ